MAQNVSRRNSTTWPQNLTCPSFPSKLVIVMIGLPARGKSYISKKLRRYLKWIGFNCKIFNAGDYRRTQIGSGQTADFYDPKNTHAREQKRACAMAALTDLISWLSKEQDNFVGIFDATNSTKARRRMIAQQCKDEKCKVLFLESICTDTKILEANYALKLQNADYKQMDPIAARADFEARIRAYETIYETLDEEDGDLSYIKLINVSDQIVTNGCSGYMVSQITTYLPHLHIQPKRVYLTRHGHSRDNFSGKIGGNASLTEAGQLYAKALREFVLLQDHPLLNVWTSTLSRATETAQPMQFEEKIKCYQTRLLNEIHAGTCEGMTYEEIAREYPEDYAARRLNKLDFRYAHGGESYVDVMERVKPLLLELERHRVSVLVISHRAVLRTMLAYFCEMDRDKMVDLDIPLHQVIQLTLTPFGCQVEKIDLA